MQLFAFFNGYLNWEDFFFDINNTKVCLGHAHTSFSLILQLEDISKGVIITVGKQLFCPKLCFDIVVNKCDFLPPLSQVTAIWSDLTYDA